MRKFVGLLAIIFCISSIPVIAEDNGMWDAYNIDANNYSPKQRFVSDDEFNEAVEKLNKQDKVKKWIKRLQGTNLPKGTQFTQANESEEINKTSGDKADLPVLSLPVDITTGEGIIPVGHYQVKGENKDGNAFLNLYQAHELIARIPARITEDDYNKEELLFADWISINDNEIKIIYGSLDFNAFAILKIK